MNAPSPGAESVSGGSGARRREQSCAVDEFGETTSLPIEGTRDA